MSPRCSNGAARRRKIARSRRRHWTYRLDAYSRRSVFFTHNSESTSWFFALLRIWIFEFWIIPHPCKSVQSVPSAFYPPFCPNKISLVTMSPRCSNGAARRRKIARSRRRHWTYTIGAYSRCSVFLPTIL